MLTKKQYKLFTFLKKYAKKNKVMPSFEEIMKHMNQRSKCSVFTMLGHIELKGYIAKHPFKARAIQIIKEYEHDV
jgi:SOS-response transcriptional repressor LexA